MGHYIFSHTTLIIYYDSLNEISFFILFLIKDNFFNMNYQLYFENTRVHAHSYMYIYIDFLTKQAEVLSKRDGNLWTRSGFEKPMLLSLSLDRSKNASKLVGPGLRFYEFVKRFKKSLFLVKWLKKSPKWQSLKRKTEESISRPL